MRTRATILLTTYFCLWGFSVPLAANHSPWRVIKGVTQCEARLNGTLGGKISLTSYLNGGHTLRIKVSGRLHPPVSVYLDGRSVNMHLHRIGHYHRGIVSEVSHEFLDTLSDSRIIDIQTHGRNYSFDLNGMDDALDELEECLDDIDR